MRRSRPRPRDRFCRVFSFRCGFDGRGFSRRQSPGRGRRGSICCRVRVLGVAIAALRRGRVAFCGPGFTCLGRVLDLLRRPISTRSIGWFWSLWTASSRAVRTPPHGKRWGIEAGFGRTSFGDQGASAQPRLSEAMMLETNKNKGTPTNFQAGGFGPFGQPLPGLSGRRPHGRILWRSGRSAPPQRSYHAGGVLTGF